MTILGVLDVVVAVLLVATISYCVTLNRRLGALRRNEAELRAVLTSFGEAAAKAETGLAELKKAGGEIGGLLRRQVAEARAIYDDLAFVTERADRLVSTVGNAAAPPRMKEPPKPRRETEPARASAPRDLSRAERELLEALASAR